MNTRQKTALTAPLTLLLRTARAGLGGIIIGGLIIIVGAIIVWKLISFMNKYFPANAGDNGGWPDPNVTNVVANIDVNFQQPQAKAPVDALLVGKDDGQSPQPCDCGCSFTVLFRGGQLVLTNASAGSVRSPVEPDVTGLPFIIEQSQDLLNWTPIQIQTHWGAVAVPCSNSFYRAILP